MSTGVGSELTQLKGRTWISVTQEILTTDFRVGIAAALVCREVILTGDGRDQADEMKKLLVRSLEGKEI